MPTTSSRRQRVLDYLAGQGGAVESADGRGLVRAMAGALGYQGDGGLNGVLAGLERDGLVVRDVRGRRTYRIALAASARRRPPARKAEPAPPSAARQEAPAPPCRGDADGFSGDAAAGSPVRAEAEAEPAPAPAVVAQRRWWWRRRSPAA